MIKQTSWCSVLSLLPQATAYLIDKDWFKSKAGTGEAALHIPTTLRANRHRVNPSSAATVAHPWKSARSLRFSILMQLFCQHCSIVKILIHRNMSGALQQKLSFFFFLYPSRECINHRSLTLLSEDREQQLGERSSTLSSTDSRRFSHHFLLWILTSIVMNTLERCLTAWAWIARTLKRAFFCLFCFLLVYLCVLDFCAFVCLCNHVHQREHMHFVGPDMSNTQSITQD